MKRLLGPPDDTIQTSTTTMRGLLYAILCSQVQPSQQQLEQVHMLLVAWHLTEAWLPGRVGYVPKRRLVQASSAGYACQKACNLGGGDCPHDQIAFLVVP